MNTPEPKSTEYVEISAEMLRQLRHYTECYLMHWPSCGAPTEAEVESSLKTRGGIEPVAWLRRSRHYGIWSEWVVCSKSDVDRVSGLESWQGMPVYTSPLPQLQMRPACFAECAPSERPAAPAQALTDEQIDQLLWELNSIAIEYDRAQYGLPMHFNPQLTNMRAAVRSLVGQDSAAPSGAARPLTSEEEEAAWDSITEQECSCCTAAVRLFCRINGIALADAGVALPARRKATDEEIAEWVKRHDLESSLKLGSADARAAFEDAESLHLTYGVPSVLLDAQKGGNSDG
jgi:hypothetical protein